MRQNVKVQSGNRVKIFFDGQAVGLLQSARFSDDYGLQPASGIGDAHVIEHVPGQAGHTISFSKMTLISEQLRVLGITPENADTVLQGNVFDVAAVSRDSGASLRTYRSCSYASGEVSVEAHRIVVTNGMLRALDVGGTGL